MFVFVKDNKINGYGGCECVNDGYINVLATEEQEENIKQYGTNYYIYDNDELVLNPNYEQEEEAKETARINNLTMTALDFIKVLKSFGLTTAEIHAYLDTNLDLKDELTFCQNVYCGVVRALLPLEVAGYTITDEMIVAAFKAKIGEV